MRQIIEHKLPGVHLPSYHALSDGRALCEVSILVHVSTGIIYTLNELSEADVDVLLP